MIGDNVEAMKTKERLRSLIDSYKLEDLLEKKFDTVDPEEGVSEIIAKMRAKDLHEMPVAEDKGKKFVGLVSEKSIIRRRNLVIGTKIRSIMDTPPEIKIDTPLTVVAEHFISTGYRQMPVLKGKTIVGMVRREGLLSIIPKIKELKSIPLHDIMTTDVQVVGFNEPVKHALEIMRNLDIRTLPVVTPEGKLHGILGVKDVIQHDWSNVKRRETKGEFVGNRDPVHLTVESLDIESPVTAGPDTTLQQAVDIMLSKKISTLPIVENNELRGIVTGYDIIQLMAALASRDIVYMQITGLEEEDRFSLDQMEKEIQTGLQRVAKMDKPMLFTMHVQKYHPSGNTAKYSLNGRLFTEREVYSAGSVDWNLMKATVDLMNRLSKMATVTKEEKLSHRKKNM
jgi:CBS domain-containing protein